MKRAAAVLAASLVAIVAMPAGATSYRVTRVVRGFIELPGEIRTRDDASAWSLTCASERDHSVQGRFAWVVPLSRREGDGRHRFFVRMPEERGGYMRVFLFRAGPVCAQPLAVGSAQTLYFCESRHCGKSREVTGAIPSGTAYATVIRGAMMGVTVGYIPVPMCWDCDFSGASFEFRVRAPAPAR